MKNPSTCIILLIATLFIASCETTGPRTKSGVGYGAATGAILGTIIGHQSGEDGEGALIGAAAGAALGGLFGNSQDQKEMRQQAEMERQRQEQIAAIQRNKEQAVADRNKMIRYGRSIEDPEVLRAKQRAESAEAKLNQLRLDRQEALKRAKELEEYRRREEAAQREIGEIAN